MTSLLSQLYPVETNSDTTSNKDAWCVNKTKHSSSNVLKTTPPHL